MIEIVVTGTPGHFPELQAYTVQPAVRHGMLAPIHLEIEKIIERFFMASTQDILKAATDLGELIGQHTAALRLQDAAKLLESDRDAQRAMVDFNRFMQEIQQKEATGQPIEVEEKHKIDALQKAVAQSLPLQNFQMAQMDYLDLMRQVDEAVSGKQNDQPAAQADQGGGAAANPNPIIT